MEHTEEQIGRVQLSKRVRHSLRRRTRQQANRGGQEWQVHEEHRGDTDEESQEDGDDGDETVQLYGQRSVRL